MTKTRTNIFAQDLSIQSLLEVIASLKMYEIVRFSFVKCFSNLKIFFPSKLACPSGFTEGIRNQDDEDDDNQTGPTDGRTTLPKVINLPDRGSVFAWYFCCGSGSPSTSISFDPIRSQLPDNFVLYQKGGSCQVINGRPVQTGWV